MLREELEMLQMLLILMQDLENPGDQLRRSIQDVLNVIEVDPRITKNK